MDTVYRVASTAGRVVRSRLFSASALAVISAIMIAFVSLNMNAITVVAGDTNRVVLTLGDDMDSPPLSDGPNVDNDQEVLAAFDVNTMAIDSAFDVQITADGITRIVRMTGGTVADAVEKVGVLVGEYDQTNVDLTQVITEDTTISIDRVAYEEYSETVTVDYTSSTKYTNTIAKGKTVLQQAGQEGQKKLTYRKCIQNGEVVGTTLVSEEITIAPVEKITLIGTTTSLPISDAPYEILLDSAGQPLKYSNVYSGRATAYSSDRGYAGTRTASGRKAEVGVVAVNPNIIPYGTELYIVSPDGSYVYGYAIAGDTGGACMSGKAVTDLFFNTYEECCQFGARTMNVYVIG